MYYTNMHSFYTSRDWNDLLINLKMSRVNSNGELICEHCGKPIVRSYDCIGHHVKELTLDNVNDASVSLNPDNIMLVHHACHNEIHKRFGSYTRHVYIVCGGSREDRMQWVNDNSVAGCLVCEIVKIKECISIGDSNRCDDNAFAVRDLLIDMIKCRRGKWINAYVVGEYKYTGERERLVNSLGAEIIDLDDIPPYQ